MPQTIKQWLKSDDVKQCKKDKGFLTSTLFFRDPMRNIHIDPAVFYSPADGIVLYAYENLKPDDAIVEVKGKKFTVKDALDDQDYDLPSMVISIFMTQYNVHVNRVPTSGYLNEEHRTPYLFTPNVSMIFEENAILEEAKVEGDLSYEWTNERRIVGVYHPEIKTKYYLIQIAEKDVDVISNWGIDKHMTQGERYGIVRFGSQVTLVLPLTDKTKYELLVKKGDCVQAGIDSIIRMDNPRYVSTSGL
jgi:phosphatidylserine decarboxylase